MQRGRFAAVVAAACALSPGARADVMVAVDTGAGAHPISPLIYGVNYADDAHVASGRISVTRWGGNSTTRYNYETDFHNTGADWYFENIPGCTSKGCADPKEGSGANSFLKGASDKGLVALFTIPTIGWTPKSASASSHPYSCGCPKSSVAQQDGFDPYDSGCGSGKSGGSFIACPAATTTSTAVDPSWARGWLDYLVGKHGPSDGRRIYELDNEPSLWSSTHHDVHPGELTYDELWQRMRDYAVAILDADPTGAIAGPVEWGWPSYFCSGADVAKGSCSKDSPDRKSHG